MKSALLVVGLLFVSTGIYCTSPAQPGKDSTSPLDWERSAEAYDKQRLQALRTQIDRNVYKQINSVVVIKNGKLLVEEYYNGSSRAALHDPRSVGKTFASALTGIALAEGHLRGPDQPLSDFYRLRQYRNYAPAKERITLRDLLTMSSNFAGDDNDDNSPGNENNMYDRPDWVKWTLDLPVVADRRAGEQWHYFTAGAVLLGDVLNQKVPGGLEKYAAAKLFRPLNITRYRWEYTPQRVPSTAGGLRMSALDFAKFGQLYQNGGQWRGQQIIPAAWVEQSLQPHQQTAFGDRYGYLWWNKAYTVGHRQHNTFYCSGNGGNKIFVFADLDLVVVVTASAYNQRYMHKQVDELMTQYVLPAVLGG